jgi:hypothetical protein
MKRGVVAGECVHLTCAHRLYNYQGNAAEWNAAEWHHISTAKRKAMRTSTLFFACSKSPAAAAAKPFSLNPKGDETPSDTSPRLRLLVLPVSWWPSPMVVISADLRRRTAPPLPSLFVISRKRRPTSCAAAVTAACTRERHANHHIQGSRSQ